MKNKKFIYNAVPDIGAKEKEYILNALNRNEIAVGSYIKKFEDYISKKVGAKYAVATSSGTTALHLALLANGIKKDDLILAPNLSFIATLNTITYCNAHPVLFDVDLKTGCIAIDQLENFIKNNCYVKNKELRHKSTGKLVRAILPVHLYGHPSDMDYISKLAKKFNLKIIEDGAAALGAMYKNNYVGSKYETCIFSFNGNKIITAGSGGMLVTNNEKIAKLTRYLSNQARDNAFNLKYGEIGYNYRMSNINAAIGYAQAKSLTKRLNKKRKIVNFYKKLLGSRNILVWQEEKWAKSSYWNPIVQFKEKTLKRGVVGLRAFLDSKGIEARSIWPPLDLQKPYKEVIKLNTKNSHYLFKHCICLPSSTNISKEEQKYVVDMIFHYLDHF